MEFFVYISTRNPPVSGCDVNERTGTRSQLEEVGCPPVTINVKITVSYMRLSTKRFSITKQYVSFEETSCSLAILFSGLKLTRVLTKRFGEYNRGKTTLRNTVTGHSGISPEEKFTTVF